LTVTDNKHSWFHCARCGSLFQSPFGVNPDRICGVCGQKPALGNLISAATPPAATLPSQKDSRSQGREKPQLSSEKSNFLILKIAAAWLLLLAFILLGARLIWNDDTPTQSKESAQIAAKKHAVSEMDTALLTKAQPLCNETFAGILQAPAPEQQNQFVLNAISTGPRIARFYSMNPSPALDPTKMTLTRNAVVNLPNGRSIETQWTSSDGHSLDAVFTEENGEWRMDWEHYARFSDFPWALFLAGNGDEVAEFRLLARERLAEERKNADTISLTLYAPRFGYSRDTGFQSPEVLVKRSSKDGQLIQKALDINKQGEQPFGVQLPSIDPEGLIRVRAKIRRVEKDGERHFEIAEVIACHWYSVDAPGMDLPPAATPGSAPADGN
jgi:hypothetical protein